MNLSQKRKIKGLNEILIYPATSLVYSKETILNVKNIKEDLETRVSFLKNIGKELEARRLEQKTNYDLEMLTEVNKSKSMENLFILMEENLLNLPPYTLMDYFPSDYLLFYR